MANSYEEEARKESASNQIMREWIRARVANIHSNVSVYHVLRRKGLGLDREDRPEQFSCPFHGKDSTPSARVYPESPGQPSACWCFVCQERWDSIGLWRKFSGTDTKFVRTLTEMERAFGLECPPYPEGLQDVYQALQQQAGEDRAADFQRKIAICDGRLRDCTRAFKYAQDLNGYVRACSLLERVEHRVQDGRMSMEEGEAKIQAILNHIRERERACPVG